VLNGIYKDKILFSMKKLIFRKFYTDISTFFLASILVVGLIVWTIQAVNYFDFVTEEGHGF
jgi:lipopolysaccharide export system permease protein